MLKSCLLAQLVPFLDHVLMIFYLHFNCCDRVVFSQFIPKVLPGEFQGATYTSLQLLCKPHSCTFLFTIILLQILELFLEPPQLSDVTVKRSDELLLDQLERLIDLLFLLLLHLNLIVYLRPIILVHR